jgi:hypothetical protein
MRRWTPTEAKTRLATLCARWITVSNKQFAANIKAEYGCVRARDDDASVKFAVFENGSSCRTFALACSVANSACFGPVWLGPRQCFTSPIAVDPLPQHCEESCR